LAAFSTKAPVQEKPLAFKHDNPEQLVEGMSIKAHLRFSVAKGSSLIAPQLGCKAHSNFSLRAMQSVP
jgi:xylose isomerase